jgi:hypothetical protein
LSSGDNCKTLLRFGLRFVARRGRENLAPRVKCLVVDDGKRTYRPSLAVLCAVNQWFANDWPQPIVNIHWLV